MAKIYSLKSGSKLPEAIVALSARGKVSTALLTAIGGVSELRIAYFNHETKKYENHDYHEELEVTSLVGNVTLKEGKPFVHVHGTFGRKDMSVIGGHVVSATVHPLLELVVTPTANKALRRFDDVVGLNVIYKA
jgi:uncharacterized protein